jgi:hypothetical protein
MVTRDNMEVGEMEFKTALTTKSRPIYSPSKNVTQVNTILPPLSLTFEFK